MQSLNIFLHSFADSKLTYIFNLFVMKTETFALVYCLCYFDNWIKADI